MKKFFAYIRVSTAKQGVEGVSLSQQRELIEHYAQSNGLLITQWFEERETAAKQGRRVFGEIIKLLRAGKADGIILHKVDRGSRNYRDWADINDLLDAGIDVRFAHESSLDLKTRGGRLVADIEAVMAVDYIRNLRDETRKGMYGRLKQGIYPLPAPLGYLDRGKGKPKEIDPIRGPLIREMFELYATGSYSLRNLVKHMYALGLRSRSGKTVVRSGIASILANPFYTGLIRIKKTRETFQGAHEPLIPTYLFERARVVASGKFYRKSAKHDFQFRRLLSCDICHHSLIGERQKGHVYYRCQTSDCQTKTIRQETVDLAVRKLLELLILDSEEQTYMRAALDDFKAQWAAEKGERDSAVRARESQISDRLNRLTDAYIDGVLDKESFEHRKTALLMESQRLKERIGQAKTRDIPTELEKILELASSACLLYETSNRSEKREVLELVISNRTLREKTLIFKLDLPFQQIADRSKNENGGPVKATSRTWSGLIRKLADLVAARPEAFVNVFGDNYRSDSDVDLGPLRKLYPNATK